MINKTKQTPKNINKLIFMQTKIILKNTAGKNCNLFIKIPKKRKLLISFVAER